MPRNSFYDDDPYDYDFLGSSRRGDNRLGGLDFGSLYGTEPVKSGRRDIYNLGFGTPSNPYEVPQSSRERYRSAAYNIPNAPEYDWGPSNRYSKYLESEPNKADYKPGIWGRLLNSASAGVEAYRTGDLARGIKLGEYLNDRPYDEAYAQWKTRGTPYARAVEQEDKRYNIAGQDWNRRVDNARADQQMQIAYEKHKLDRLKAEHEIDEDTYRRATNGWQLVDGPGGPTGFAIQQRVGPNGMEYIQTKIPNRSLGALQQQLNFEQTRRDTNYNAAQSRAVTRRGQDQANEYRDRAFNEGVRRFGITEERLSRNAGGGKEPPTTQQGFVNREYEDLKRGGMVTFIPGSTEVNLLDNPDDIQKQARKMAIRELNFGSMEGPSQVQLDAATARIIQRFNKMRSEMSIYGWRPVNRSGMGGS